MDAQAGIGIEKKATGIEGCWELQPIVRRDGRGSFVKVFHAGWFRELGLPADFREAYYSVSEQNVLRGLHFQIPPMGHAKLVYCCRGEILDVALDLRKASETYGKHCMARLSARQGNMMFLPEGFAHGFCVLKGPAIVAYHVTSVYSPEHDQGVRWDSAGIPWPIGNPLLSERDKGFSAFADFASPF